MRNKELCKKEPHFPTIGNLNLRFFYTAAYEKYTVILTAVASLFMPYTDGF